MSTDDGCKRCGAACERSRCADCAKARNDAERAKTLADRGGVPARFTCGGCGQRGHRRTNCEEKVSA